MIGRLAIVLVAVGMMGVFLFGALSSPRMEPRTASLDKQATSSADQRIKPGQYVVLDETPDPTLPVGDHPTGSTTLRFIGGDSFWGRPAGDGVLVVTQAPDAYSDLIGHRIRSHPSTGF